ncbi:FAD dependent oxidoreductase superfamily protein [Kwoniella heveanensis BCC8398]|uniref:FAD dependent oxidoreductase superfamily protein n=1 Tax=Kwoniella heveanensis BCC8398 TaxID=1296120 RepID=A0A1B9GMA4_9TREE|nr:FAD dependent oxidoreductase superfamily protein [Kwoniella heveanensis BCC8398]
MNRLLSRRALMGIAAPLLTTAVRTDQDRLLPVKNRTESFWLSERDHLLQNARTTPDLPRSADVVIVGSGLTGAMMSYHIHNEAQRRGKRIKVVMLEADEFCGGATARNGGHCKPMTIFGYRAEAAKHGAETANHLLTFEAAALEQYADIVAKEDIDCDMHVTRAFDVCFRKEDGEAGKKDYEARKAAWEADMTKHDLRVVDDPQELERLTGVRGGHWGASYPAGHLWPYKLASALVHIGLQRGLNLQTHTPALSLEPSTAHAGQWEIRTPRGNITTPSVIVATNAYTSGFLPEFKNLIFPVRGTACSITPAPSHSHGSDPGPIKYTYGFRHAPGEVDYMIPRQGRGRVPGRGDRSIILGGAKGCFLPDIDQWYNNKNDNEQMPGAKQYFEDYMKRYFVGWNGDEHGNVDIVWSGILGYSSDLLPYVGEVPDKPGVFMCAGFTGHGMPRIPGCTAALASLAASRLSDGFISPEADQAFRAALPKPYWLTRQRFESKVNLIKEAMGQGNKAQVDVQQADEAVLAARAAKAKL